jgi:hypothetical protein
MVEDLGATTSPRQTSTASWNAADRCISMAPRCAPRILVLTLGPWLRQGHSRSPEFPESTCQIFRSLHRSFEELMGWADGHIARLARGETVEFRPRGHSMTGKVNDGQLCTVQPLGDHVPMVGDIVLCRVKANQYLHLVKAIQGERFQIGNNRGGINGWITRRQIFGLLTAVTP